MKWPVEAGICLTIRKLNDSRREPIIFKELSSLDMQTMFLSVDVGWKSFIKSLFRIISDNSQTDRESERRYLLIWSATCPSKVPGILWYVFCFVFALNTILNFMSQHDRIAFSSCFVLITKALWIIFLRDGGWRHCSHHEWLGYCHTGGERKAS